MTVSRYATQAGKAYEKELLDYCRGLGHDTERLRLAGVEDEGDLILRPGAVFRQSKFVIEAKREKGFNLAGWVKEAQAEADNYGKHRGLLAPVGFMVVHKARGKGTGGSYVTTTLDEFMSWWG